MEMHQIRYFMAVCNTLNFTRAAEVCNVTQPALTRAIQKLEEEFGGLLFRRERKLTHMTDLGHLVRPQLEAILKQTDKAKSTAKSFMQLKDAPLSLGVMCTVGPLRFIGFLSEFGAGHPGIEVSLSEDRPDRLLDLLMSGKLDIAIMTRPDTENERIETRQLYEERFVVAFPAGHRFATMTEVPINEIAGESYLLRSHCEKSDELADLLESRMVEYDCIYQSEREDWIQSMIMAGMGIAFMPEFSPILRGLQTRPLVNPEVARDVSLVTVAGRRFSPAVAAFVKAVDRFRWPERPVVALSRRAS